jgi:hypothetical protein
MIAADIWHNVLKLSPAGDLAKVSVMPAYRFAVPPLIVLFSSWQPVWLSLLASVLQGALTPLLIFVLLRLCNDRGLRESTPIAGSVMPRFCSP